MRRGVITAMVQQGRGDGASADVEADRDGCVEEQRGNVQNEWIY